MKKRETLVYIDLVGILHILFKWFCTKYILFLEQNSNINMKALLFLFVYSLTTLTHSATEEWFSSLGVMEELLKNEQDLVKNLEDYLQAEEKRLDNIKSALNQFEQVSHILLFLGSLKLEIIYLKSIFEKHVVV